MGVERYLLPAKEPGVGNSITSPPDYNIHLATWRISQFESQFENPSRHSRRSFLRMLGLGTIGIATGGAAYALLPRNDASAATTSPTIENKTEPLNLTATEVFGNNVTTAENTLINPDTQTTEKVHAQETDTGVGSDYTKTYIDPLGNRIEWSAFNGTSGIPPNNPDHDIDKIFVSVNNFPRVAFQENETQFPSDTNHITVEGHWMDTKLNIAYVVNTIERNSTGGRSLPVIAILLDAKNVTNSPVVDASKQTLVLGLLQNAGLGDRYKYFKVDSDDKGGYIKFGIQQSINPKDDGDYMIRLDNNGLPVGKPVKIESAVMSRRGFIPFIGNTYTGK